jgi:hypothetical protein
VRQTHCAYFGNNFLIDMCRGSTNVVCDEGADKYVWLRITFVGEGIKHRRTQPFYIIYFITATRFDLICSSSGHNIKFIKSTFAPIYVSVLNWF